MENFNKKKVVINVFELQWKILKFSVNDNKSKSEILMKSNKNFDRKLGTLFRAQKCFVSLQL